MKIKIVKSALFLIPFIFLFFLLWQKDFELSEDLGRHTVLGRIILKCHCIPTTNLFSYSYPNFYWFTNSWLSAVGFYKIFINFGKDVLLYLKIILITISFSFLYIYAFKRYSKFWSIIFSIPIIYIFYFRFGLRPEIFSFILISLFLFLIEKYKGTSQHKYLLLLIPLEILWVNLHIYFIFGIAVYLCLLLEKTIQRKFNKKLTVILALLIFSTFINPLTLKLAFLPLTIFNNYGGNVLENQTVFTYFQNFGYSNSPHALSFILFELMSVLLVISYLVFIKNYKSISIYYLLLSILGIITAGRMLRFLPLFSMLTFLPFVINAKEIEKILSKNKDIIITGRALAVITCIILIFMVFIMTNSNQLSGLTFEESYKGEADFIKNNHISGPMLNDFANGSYLIFRLYPNQKVFIDARSEAYPSKFVNSYNDMLTNPKTFEALDKKYKFNYIVFNNEPGFTSEFIKYMLGRKEWVVVYVDHIGNIIFLKNTNSNAELIKKFAVNERINVIE